MRRLALVAVIFAACPMPVLRPTPDGFTIEPASAQASPGQVINMVAAVTLGAPPVVWTVAGGGSITPAGAFTAPTCADPLPATITITATSGATVAKSTITVADTVTSVAINPPTVAIAPGGTYQFTATIKTVCVPAGVTAMQSVAPAKLARAKP
jgi:hypothetical protein